MVPRPMTSIGDLSSRRITGFARVLIALLVAALTSVETLPLPLWFAWVAALLWLPGAVVLWFAEEGPASTLRTRAGITLDLTALVSIMALAPDLAPTALLVMIPLAAATAYQSGAALGFAFVAIGLVGRIAVAVWRPPTDEPIQLMEEVTIGLVAVCVVLLMERAVGIRRHDARRMQEFADTSQTIMSRSTEGIVVTDTGGVVTQANPAADRVLIDIDARPLVGHGCTDRLSLRSPTGKPLDCSTSCALAELCSGTDAVEVLRVVGEERQPLLASAIAITGSDGSRSVMHSFRDITSLKQADEAKTMFLATASHELKTPLTVIRGFTQLLQGTVADPQAQVALSAIENRSRELATIIDRLLLSSRIEDGRVDLPLDDIDLSELLNGRKDGFGQALGLAVELEVQPDLQVRANAGAILTVVDLLVDNAAKYSRNIGTVRVVARATPRGAAVEVIDRGIGMTPDQADRCFDKFWQAEASDVRRFGGTGIGLYIVRSMVDGMDGTVTVTSTLGAGSTFAIDLPALPLTQEASDGVAQPSGAPDGRKAQPVTVDEFMQQLGITTGAP